MRIVGARKVVTLVPLSVSSRPSEAKTDIAVSPSFFSSIRRPCFRNSKIFPMPSRGGGGTSLDQPTLTKTLRPCNIGMGLYVCVWVDVTLDFTQKPGEGEMLTVTFEAMKRPDRPHRGPLPFLLPSSWTGKRKTDSPSHLLVSGVSHCACGLFSRSFPLSLFRILESQHQHGHTAYGSRDSPAHHR